MQGFGNEKEKVDPIRIIKWAIMKYQKLAKEEINKLSYKIILHQMDISIS